MISSDFSVEGFVAVSGLDIADFVAPPHDRLPVRLIVFKKLDVVVWVLSESTHNILFACLLVPLDTLECKYLEGLGYVEDGSLLGVFVFEVNAGSGSIFVFWHHMNSTLRKLHEQDTWVQLLINEVLNLRLLHFHKLYEKWMNFNIYLNTLSFDGQERDLFPNASDIPRVIWEICGFLLKVGEWCKLSGVKFHLTLLPIKRKLLNVVS